MLLKLEDKLFFVGTRLNQPGFVLQDSWGDNIELDGSNLPGYLNNLTPPYPVLVSAKMGEDGVLKAIRAIAINGKMLEKREGEKTLCLILGKVCKNNTSGYFVSIRKDGTKVPRNVFTLFYKGKDKPVYVPCVAWGNIADTSYLVTKQESIVCAYGTLKEGAKGEELVVEGVEATAPIFMKPKMFA